MLPHIIGSSAMRWKKVGEWENLVKLKTLQIVWKRIIKLLPRAAKLWTEAPIVERQTKEMACESFSFMFDLQQCLFIAFFFGLTIDFICLAVWYHLLLLRHRQTVHMDVRQNKGMCQCAKIPLKMLIFIAFVDFNSKDLLIKNETKLNEMLTFLCCCVALMMVSRTQYSSNSAIDWTDAI